MTIWAMSLEVDGMPRWGIAAFVTDGILGSERLVTSGTAKNLFG
jgi:hypothetical protein